MAQNCQRQRFLNVARDPTVLFVEDELLIAETVADALRAEGLRVIEAPNAEAAILIVTTGGFQFDVLLTDVHFPFGRNGFELVQWFRPRQPQARIFVASGAVTPREAHAHLDDEVTFIAKPYDITSLASKVATVANENSKRR